MKTFVLAPDSFKESLTAKEVCIAMEKGLKKRFPHEKYLHVPMADGGEGTMQALVDATNGEIKKAIVQDPLGREIISYYGILGDGKTGVIEMSLASGLELLRPSERAPLKTTTYGTGQLITACLDEGLSKIIIGIGGSATNDGGAGMAQAVGVKFLDKEAQEVPRGGGHLNKIETIDLSGLDFRVETTLFIVASDVSNPLCGSQGASVIFGPQKGATSEMVKQLDQNLGYYATLIEEQIGVQVKDIPGAGAAGGLGAGLLAFTEATLESGIDLMIQATQLEDKIREADYVFTGEGRIDQQTKFGKAAQGIAQLAKKNDKKVIALAGTVGKEIDELYDQGFTSIFSILPGVMTLENALNSTAENIENTCRNLAYLL
ncbi:glycerate kinase family protein [Vagococcus sp.]|uniref:glycerate kinase family protein n=1 Tax=Vagococcus sp. TaxID=1933889 RepID=UPI003F970321